MFELFVPAACFAGMIFLTWREYRLYNRHRAQADVELRRAQRQERVAQTGLHPRTGDVTPAPRLAPVVPCAPTKVVKGRLVRDNGKVVRLYPLPPKDAA